MITPAFGLTATERVLPKLALDFTTASLDPRVTFTRTTGASNPATFVNSSGYVTAATNNQPRFDYDPIALTCKGLLIEESRTNSLTYSEQFDNARWTVDNASISANAATSPANDLTADKLVENSANSTHRLRPTVSDPNVNGQWSIYAKAAGRTQILIFDAVATKGYGFDLSNGTAFAVSGISSVSAPFIVSMGNGWYRCGINTPVSTNVNLYLMSNSTTFSYQGDGTSGVYLWGAQLEAGAFPTSYIPTTLLPLTRNADVATMTGTNFSDWFNASEGTFVVSANTPPAAFYNPIAYVSDNTTNNSIRLGQTASGVCDYTVVSSGVASCSFQSTSIANTSVKLAASYKTDYFARSVNSAAVSTDTSGSVPTVSRLQIGTNPTPYYLNGIVKKILYFNIKLTNAELQAESH